MNFRTISSSSLKNAVGILIGIALNLQIALGRVAIFTILILPIHEHVIYFHLLVSLISLAILNLDKMQEGGKDEE